MLLELFGLDVEDEWNEGSKTFTTGATASNVLGLACGREGVLRWALRRDGDVSGKGEDSVGQLGILDACRRAGIERLQVLTTMPHSSIRKAAAVVGLGRAAVVDCGDGDNGLAFDWQKLSVMLECERSASLVVVSCGEVNTGGFATHSYEEMQRLRELCDKHGAWLHVDGGKQRSLVCKCPKPDGHLAFGIFARTLKGIPEFERVASGAVGIELADSIAGDAHKLLNVPYDCGFFFCRHPQLVQQVFQNPNAAYLSTGNNKADSIGSPLNVGIENSRRFRGLPVYATLTAYGRDGYRDMLIRQVRFARAVAAYLRDSQELELLPQSPKEDTCGLEKIFIIVIFKAKDAGLNSQLVKRINTSNKVYVSGTIWDGEPASRIAVSNWQVERARDMDIVRMVLQNVLHEWRAETMNKEKTG
ncbi:hypothetical protein MMC24_002057 [Lignoscripta atroalba]|nr:hypothetical protein [Lignoscripta atroalba]